MNNSKANNISPVYLVLYMMFLESFSQINLLVDLDQFTYDHTQNIQKKNYKSI